MRNGHAGLDLATRLVESFELLADAHAERVECANQSARRLWRVGALLVLAGIGVAGGMATRALGWLDAERGPAVAVIPVEGWSDAQVEAALREIADRGM